MSAADYYGLSGLAQALNKLWTLSQSMSEPDRRTLVAKISETPLQTALPGIDPGLAQHVQNLHVGRDDQSQQLTSVGAATLAILPSGLIRQLGWPIVAIDGYRSIAGISFVDVWADRGDRAVPMTVEAHMIAVAA